MKKDTENVDKVIKNNKGVRTAVSWPSNEDLPEGVLEGRPKHMRTATDDLEVKNEDIENNSKATNAEQEKVVKKPIKKRVRKAAVKK